MTIRITRPAEQDLTDIRNYIAEHNAPAADQVIARILQSIRYLSYAPRLGRPGIVPGTRELSIPGLNYKVVYRIDDDVIEILTVVHTRRQWP